MHGGSNVGSDANLELEAGATNTGVDDGGQLAVADGAERLGLGVEYSRSPRNPYFSGRGPKYGLS